MDKEIKLLAYNTFQSFKAMTLIHNELIEKYFRLCDSDKKDTNLSKYRIFFEQFQKRPDIFPLANDKVIDGWKISDFLKGCIELNIVLEMQLDIIKKYDILKIDKNI